MSKMHCSCMYHPNFCFYLCCHIELMVVAYTEGLSRADFNYLFTCDLYRPVCKVFDAGKSITIGGHR
jgi:hypothetical protein